MNLFSLLPRGGFISNSRSLVRFTTGGMATVLLLCWLGLPEAYAQAGSNVPAGFKACRASNCAYVTKDWVPCDESKSTWVGICKEGLREGKGYVIGSKAAVLGSYKNGRVSGPRVFYERFTKDVGEGHHHTMVQLLDNEGGILSVGSCTLNGKTGKVLEKGSDGCSAAIATFGVKSLSQTFASVTSQAPSSLDGDSSFSQQVSSSAPVTSTLPGPSYSSAGCAFDSTKSNELWRLAIARSTTWRSQAEMNTYLISRIVTPVTPEVLASLRKYAEHYEGMFRQQGGDQARSDVLATRMQLDYATCLAGQGRLQAGGVPLQSDPRERKDAPVISEAQVSCMRSQDIKRPRDPGFSHATECPPARPQAAAGIDCRAKIIEIHQALDRRMRATQNDADQQRAAMRDANTQQLELFSGACASHPSAAQYVASARQALGGSAGTPSGGTGTGGGGRGQHDPAGIAHSCIRANTQSAYGGFTNTCGYPVSYIHCFLNPEKDRHDTAFFHCNRPGGLWADQTTAGNVKPGATDGTGIPIGGRILAFACRAPYSPRGVRFDGSQLVGRCVQ